MPNFPRPHASTHLLDGIDPLADAPPGGAEGAGGSVFIQTRDDFPDPVGGVITLEPGQDYLVLGPVDMGDTALAIDGASLRGYSPQSSVIFWPSPPVGGAAIEFTSGWIEGLTIGIAGGEAVRHLGTGEARLQIVDLLVFGVTTGLVHAMPGSDGLMMFDVRLQGAPGLVIEGGLQAAQCSFDLTSSPPGAVAVQVPAGTIGAGVFIDGSQVRTGDATHAAFAIDPGSDFAADYAGFVHGVQVSGPGSLGLASTPPDWRLRANPQGNYLPAVRQISVPAIYDLTERDEVVQVDTTAGPVILNFYPTYEGHRILVQDVGGNAAVNPITCAGQSGAQIDVAAVQAISVNHGSFDMFCSRDFVIGAFDWWITGA